MTRAAVVMAEFDLTNVPPLEKLDVWPTSASAFIAFGILVVSFCAHYNLPTQYKVASTAMRFSFTPHRFVFVAALRSSRTAAPVVCAW